MNRAAFRLDHMTWPEVEARLAERPGVFLPTGSTEQHGPIGLIGTDALCAEAIAEEAALRSGALVAPTLAYAPAPFNTAFAGTVSVSAETFGALAAEVLSGLAAQGFRAILALNGHGANLAPLRAAIAGLSTAQAEIRLRSWWDFEPADRLRKSLYGDWEGMHATPSEVAITQARHRLVPRHAAAEPPEKLSAAFIAAHAGDRHGPPDAHRAQFPDGRVGSHSALARPEHGALLLGAAAEAAAAEMTAMLAAPSTAAGASAGAPDPS